MINEEKVNEYLEAKKNEEDLVAIAKETESRFRESNAELFNSLSDARKKTAELKKEPQDVAVKTYELTGDKTNGRVTVVESTDITFDADEVKSWISETGRDDPKVLAAVKIHLPTLRKLSTALTIPSVEEFPRYSIRIKEND